MASRLAVCIVLSASALALSAQDVVPSAVTDQNRTGALPFSSTIQGAADSVDLSGGGLSIHIPLARVKGRGGEYTVELRYSSLFWAIHDYTGSDKNNYSQWASLAGDWLPGHVVGWETNQPYITWIYSKPTCLGESGTSTYSIVKDNFILTDEFGTKHSLNYNQAGGGCYGYQNYGPDDTNTGIMTYGMDSGSIPGIYTADGKRYLGGGTAPTPAGTGS